jgi:hypothetical protein
MSVAVTLALCCLAAGCAASGGSVDQDPLTQHLGTSATTVRRIEAQWDPAKLARWGTASDRRNVQRANKLIERLVAGDVAKVSSADLDRFIAHPDDMYGAARGSQRRIQEWVRQLRVAEIAEEEFSDSSASTREFMRDYNTFVQRTRAGYEQLEGFFDRGVALKAPSVRFLRAARSAIAAHNAHAYQAARDRYVRVLRKVGDALVGTKVMAGLTQAGKRADQALEQLRHDANGADDVSRLIEAVIKRYPNSVFAAHWKR